MIRYRMAKVWIGAALLVGVVGWSGAACCFAKEADKEATSPQAIQAGCGRHRYQPQCSRHRSDFLAEKNELNADMAKARSVSSNNKRKSNPIADTWNSLPPDRKIGPTRRIVLTSSMPRWRPLSTFRKRHL